MKHRLILILIVFLLAWPPSGFATDFHFQDTDYTCGAGKVLTNELWLMARTIDLKGEAMDDLLLYAETSNAGITTNASSTVQVGGIVQGSIWAAGESIETTGIIERHARLLGYRFVEISGQIKRNLIAVGGTISMPASAVISGNALFAGREVMLEGSVAGNTTIYAESATLAGSFTGNVTIVASAITVMPGTRIGGNLNYRMNQELILDSGVALRGNLIRLETPVAAPKKATLGDYIMQLGLCMAAILAGLAFSRLFPVMTGLCMQRITDSFWKSLLIGFVAFCLIPTTAFFLLFTIIGIPLSLIALLFYIILLYLGKIIAALYLGQWMIYRHTKPPVIHPLPLLTLGLATLYTAAMIPFPIDILVWFTFTLLGMGAIVGAILDRRTPVLMAYPTGKPPVAPPPLTGLTP
jgi:cytoskeletal protein CcmA (bactofilin family)